MAEQQMQLQPHDQQQQQNHQKTASPREETMVSYVGALEAALLPCLPARELQAIDRSAHSSHQIDVERHARDFMEAAKKLQLYFIGLQQEDQPTKKEILQKFSQTGVSTVRERPVKLLGAAPIGGYGDDVSSNTSLKVVAYQFTEISIMEEELKTKNELIKKHERLIEGWRKELKGQLEKHITELERV